MTKSYGVQLPDLTGSIINIPSQIKEDKIITVNIEVSNIGEVDVDAFQTTLDVSGIIIENGKVKWIKSTIGESDVEDLEAGTTKVLNFTWKPETPGAYTLEAYVDAQEQVWEGDKTNNIAQVNIEVTESIKIWPYIIVGVLALIIAIGLLFYREKILLFTQKMRVQLARVISKY
jgi:subtilase family serine protease